MPKANEAKNTKVTAVADPKNVETSEETKIAAPEQAAEKPVDAAEKKDEAAEKTKAAPVAKETKTRGPRKTAAKKPAAKKGEKIETVYIQFAGQEYEISAIMEKVKAATKSLRAVHEINVYVKPEENRAYYVAKKTKGEEVGSVEI